MARKSKLTIAMGKIRKLKVQQVLPYILIVSAVVGLVASFVLTLDHISLLKDASYDPNCNLNPVLACGPIMRSQQASVLGFPNPILGLASFAAMGCLGVVILAGAKMKAWFWKVYSLNVIGSLIFMIYFMYQSIFVIHAICIYCLSVWIVLILSSWYIFQFMLAEKHIVLRSRKVSVWLRTHHGDVLIALYILLTVLILKEFWYYYGPKLGF